MNDVRIISALIAGLVSLLGLLVSIHLSKTAIRNERIKMIIDLEKSSKSKEIEEITSYSRKIELARIITWQIQGKLSVFADDENTTLVSLIDKLEQVNEDYSSQWANLKAVVSPQLAPAITKQHHDLRGAISCVIHGLRRFEKTQEKSRSRRDMFVEDMFVDLIDSIKIFRKAADDSIQFLADIRRSILYESGEK